MDDDEPGALLRAVFQADYAWRRLGGVTPYGQHPWLAELMEHARAAVMTEAGQPSDKVSQIGFARDMEAVAEFLMLGLPKHDRAELAAAGPEVLPQLIRLFAHDSPALSRWIAVYDAKLVANAVEKAAKRTPPKQPRRNSRRRS
ncbi:hypothetical protein [Rhodopila sp.]|uniref:hypothetical protein n=1 Tax=Rhodopila sp. TaxID=2480087 RepID=UPI003D14D705